VLLLRLLAAGERRGLAMSEVTAQAGLHHPTVHRLLHQRVSERLVHRDADTRRFSLVTLAFELGVAAAQQYDFRSRCRPAFERLAAEVGDTAYLVVRSGDEAVCIDREEGPSPIRVITFELGSRRTPGVGPGGLAILAALREPECSSLLEAFQPRLAAEWRLAPTTMQRSIKEAVRDGHALIRNRITPGTSAVGCAIRDRMGNPFAAVGVAAINTRLEGARILDVARQMNAAAREMEAVTSSGRPLA
jgi:DNA-binding IclR family transcriptional regulator